MGAWDEVVLGNNWINVGAQHFVWSPDGTPKTPQVIVLERNVTTRGEKIEFGDERRIRDIVGWSAIVEWVRSGAPLPAEVKR